MGMKKRENIQDEETGENKEKGKRRKKREEGRDGKDTERDAGVGERPEWDKKPRGRKWEKKYTTHGERNSSGQTSGSQQVTCMHSETKVEPF